MMVQNIPKGALPMNRLRRTIAGLLGLAFVAVLSFGGPKSALAEVTGDYDVIQLMLEFRPGAWTPPHTHGGYILVSPQDGELTVRDSQGVEKKFKTGESFVETPGLYLEIGNASSSGVHVAVVALLPKGALLTTNKDGATSQNPPPGPTTIARTQMAVTGAPTALPKTGADASPDYVWLVALGGLGLLALGWVIRRRSSPG
jgi:LPXTG-motif cell wall-anchored protein